jgi:hypothetical protein
MHVIFFQVDTIQREPLEIAGGVFYNLFIGEE